jgi:hypothetical protein
MAYCISCKKEVGCGCNLLEGRFCTQNCKDKYLNVSNVTQQSTSVPELQLSQGVTEQNR